MKPTSAQRADDKAGAICRKPFLDKSGTLVIPHDVDARYRWWAGGQGILDTLAELGASEQVTKRYSSRARPP